MQRQDTANFETINQDLSKVAKQDAEPVSMIQEVKVLADPRVSPEDAEEFSKFEDMAKKSQVEFAKFKLWSAEAKKLEAIEAKKQAAVEVRDEENYILKSLYY